jgi:hypothetical protein
MLTKQTVRMLLSAALISVVWVGSAHAKRMGPKAVKPVTHAGVRYVVKHWAVDSKLKHNGGYIEAQNAATGKKLWGLTVYAVQYNPRLERDVQDVFITSMRYDKKSKLLLVTNEVKHAYRVDPVKRTSTHVIGSGK